MTNSEHSRPSSSRETLRQLMAGRDGLARGEKEFTAADLPEGSATPIHSLVFPPCQCPRCR
ncbi:hypothetical protein [Streptomyces sp. MUM 178J]|uniref:hypothetical protein n=1 Tax=Streptomyces sp. MUM 178J TaxID=2791991 RepID=UPI001F03D58E|nr:hypothetical protein [Streptomyces sp. MUM 178J]WRQ83011.1 hypothetical protein I3F59_028710 [Streptomyces sp. MUM 178J]